MSDYDWSKFESKMYINATPERIYRAWMSQEGMEAWFLKSCEFNYRHPDELARGGDEYTWTWYTKDSYTDRGKIIEAQAPGHFSFTFGPATCKVTIKEEHDSTLVHITQEGIPTDERSKVMWHLGCQTGWTYFLTVLKAHLEHGIDLRDKDLRRLEDCNEYHESI